jgi:hypothetical protein
MSSRPIAPETWDAELDRFSRDHEGALVSVSRRAADGRTAVEARDLPLQGVSRMSRGSNDIAVAVGGLDAHVTHDVHGAVALRVEMTADDTDRALVIDADDGSTTRIEFESER